MPFELRDLGLGLLASLAVAAAVRGQTLPASNPAPVSRAVMQKVFEEVKTPFKYGVVMQRPPDRSIDCPCVFRYNDHWYMMYVEYTPSEGYQTMLATSDDLLAWKNLGTILPFRKEGWDAWQADAGLALIDTAWGGSMAPEKFDNKYWASYIGGALKGMEPDPLSTGLAWADAPDYAGEWKRLERNPILAGKDEGARSWEKTTIFKTSIIRDPKERLGAPFLMYYNARTKSTLESIGMAISQDMVTWHRFPVGQDAALVQSANSGGVGISGDPQLVRMTVEERELWVMFYFGFQWKSGASAFDTFAASYDLVHWTKWEGATLVQSSEPYDKTFAHKPWVLKHDGVVYHFYCSVGNGGRQIALATSKDLGKAPAATRPATGSAPATTPGSAPATEGLH
jgi:predicted GH43/DUF377 family glycosyl hydrolase